MEDRPSRRVMIIGGAVVGALWIGSGVLAWQGTWWPLIVVLGVAVSAGVLSLSTALYMRGRAGASLANARLEREGGEPEPRAASARIPGSAAPARLQQGKRRGSKNKKRSGRRR